MWASPNWREELCRVLVIRSGRIAIRKVSLAPGLLRNCESWQVSVMHRSSKTSTKGLQMRAGVAQLHQIVYCCCRKSLTHGESDAVVLAG